jgi:hypothetical protein
LNISSRKAGRRRVYRMARKRSSFHPVGITGGEDKGFEVIGTIL